VTIRGTSIAILAASAEPDQLARSAAGPHKAGIAAAFDAHSRGLLEAVRAASVHGDVVVVYLHWGTEGVRCPNHKQVALAKALAGAGADIIVGSHAHVLLGSGWMGDSYVNYGLGNFLWYHNGQPESGVLQVRVQDGAVVSDSWAPAQIQTFGRPRPLHGEAREDAVADWRRLRGCTDLSGAPPT
jgi:poly-gamma-glutamate capsule biosynthesis protein CapA/YwtB (metallophosphatase superfamily)